MNEKTIMDALFLLLTEDYEVDDTVLADTALVLDYEAAGVLTRNNGLVLQMEDGSCFHITITKAR